MNEYTLLFGLIGNARTTADAVEIYHINCNGSAYSAIL